LSSIGIGTYLGAMNEATDHGYVASVMEAVGLGVNFIDTSLNYRHQRSEHNIGAALEELFRTGSVAREEIVICTKAGFLVPDAIPPGLPGAEVVGDIHCMAPEFLDDQLERSRRNLGVETIDVMYVHNPEMQLSSVPREEFDARIRRAFAFLETVVAQGRIRYYGTATWDGYRRQPGAADGLDLAHMVEQAREAGGKGHHFRFIQLPLNLAMPEAVLHHGGNPSLLDIAQSAGISVVASASLLQARLSGNLPEDLARILGASTDAQRAIQFTRSTPGIAVALIGMSKPEHVRENLQLAGIPPLRAEVYQSLFSRG